MGTRALEMFGRTVRQLRKQRHLSQEALAEAAHLNRSYLSEIEGGLVAPSLLIVLRLARALDVPLSKLLEDFTPSVVKRMKL
jgi:transcriptional regulator with XRE-family HTH domain